LAGEKILIVDDEEGMRRLLVRVLAREGYQAAAAESGAEAMRRIAGESFDLVITDIQMPGMIGLALLLAGGRFPG